MYSQYKVSGYNITTDPDFQNERQGYTDELRNQFDELYIESQNKKNKKIINMLTGLILKYPKSAQLKNFLSVAYSVRGNYNKSIEINNWILTEHPDYLFAKINLAYKYISAGQPEKVPEVLGAAMEIKELYPDRDLFHLSEVTSFYKAAILYYARIENLELAENRLNVLKEIAPGHPDTESAETFLYPLRMEKTLERWKKENEAEINVDCVKPVPVSKQKTAPVFNHPEINNLYQYGIAIPHEKLREILSLPRKTVIADLEKILQDGVDRYQHFITADLGEESVIFPLHAICLLAELKSENSLPAILSFLENNKKVLEFWLGDHVTATIWMPLYSLSQNQSNLFKQFLLKPGIDTFSKNAVSDVLAQTAMHDLQKRNEIATIYKEVLSYYLHAELKDNIIDSNFLGLAIGAIIDCGFTELLPLIKELFDKGYVSVSISGSYDEVEKYLKDPSSRKDKNKIENIFELYETILNTWAGYSEKKGYSEYDDYEEIPQPAVSNKIGRNDPCPCGSGKKYKKCCMNKLTL